LAVRRFTGFCTAGEIARQKRVVVGRTQFDQVELTGTASRTVKPSGNDFQYNPPYTIPVLRRNEIAVPASEYDNVKDEWTLASEELPATD
jgi:hypothetical protein